MILLPPPLPLALSSYPRLFSNLILLEIEGLWRGGVGIRLQVLLVLRLVDLRNLLQV